MIQVAIPRLNANEDEVLVAEIDVELSSFVEEGDLLFVLESAKAAVEINSPNQGYISEINIKVGESYTVGHMALSIVDDLSDVDEAGTVKKDNTSSVLVKENPDINFAKNRLLKIKGMQLAAYRGLELTPQRTGDGKIPVVIFGAGDHAMMVSRLIQLSCSFYTYGVLTPNVQAGEYVHGIRCLGPDEIFPSLRSDKGLFAALACGMLDSLPTLRRKIFSYCMDSNAVLPIFVHPSAEVDPSAVLGPGVQVHPKAVIGANARIGGGSVINTGAIVSHDCQIGSLVHIAPGAVLAGHVGIGDGCLIGMGATIFVGVEVSKNTVIINGDNVLHSR